MIEIASLPYTSFATVEHVELVDMVSYILYRGQQEVADEKGVVVIYIYYIIFFY